MPSTNSSHRRTPSKPSFAPGMPSSSGSSPSPTSDTMTAPSQKPSRTKTYDADSSSSESDDNDLPLPFPAALTRTDFLAPKFDPADYLSSLVQTHRHQTLEDLRSDLRERSSNISYELLELVNANYTSFLSLGSELKGGEERVEDVRVSLLGFRRQVEEIKSKVKERGTEVGGLNKELLSVRRDIEMGRLMLEMDERLSGLEGRLSLGSDPKALSRGNGSGGGVGGAAAVGDGSDFDDDDSDDDTDEQEDGSEDDDFNADHRNGETKGSSPTKLAQLARTYNTIDDIADEIGRDKPFVRKMEERMIRCRNTILLDLSTAVKEVRKQAKVAVPPAGASGRKGNHHSAKMLKLMNIYAVMDAQAEGVKALKSV